MAADFGRSGTSGRPAARDAVAAAEEVAADPGLAATDAVDAPSDPLEGWDRGSLVDLDDWRSGQADGPSDAAIIGIAAAVGALLGLLLGRPGRLAAMVFGAILGAGAGAASRRVWELDT